MTPKPLYNALTALAYVICVVTLINKGSQLAGAQVEAKDNLLMPIGMLSLFVLSVATMAYLFFYQPIVLLIDGKKKEAMQFLGRTILIFAGLTFSILLVGILIFK